MVSRSLFSSHINNDIMAVASQHCNFYDDDYQKKHALQVVRDYYAAIDNSNTVDDHNWWDRIGKDMRNYILRWRELLEVAEVYLQQRKKVVALQAMNLRVRTYHHMPCYYDNYCTLTIDGEHRTIDVAIFPVKARIIRNEHGTWCHFTEHPYWSVDPLVVPTIGMA